MLGAKVLNFEVSHQRNVFDGYSNAKLPFNRARNKEHIPDAFIFESIKDLNNQYKNMIVFVGDNQIKKACGEYGIVCLEKLITFIHQKEIQNKIKLKELTKKLQDEEFFDCMK